MARRVCPALAADYRHADRHDHAARERRRAMGRGQQRQRRRELPFASVATHLTAETALVVNLCIAGRKRSDADGGQPSAT